jgi:hypothetical protein
VGTAKTLTVSPRPRTGSPTPDQATAEESGWQGASPEEKIKWAGGLALLRR